MSESKPIRVVQITDPHLLQQERATMFGLNTQLCFDEVLKAACQCSFDVGIITGDISHDETEHAYLRLKKRLSSVGKPFYFIPGNHDNWGLMQQHLQSAPLSCDKHIVMGNWQLVMLNSQVVGQVGGCLARSELQFLEQCLQSNQAEHTLVCLHHNPVTMQAKWMAAIGLSNPNELFEMLANYPKVKVVLWGHVHQVFDETREGLRLLSTPSSCFQFKPDANQFELDLLPPGYRWLELYQDGRVETAVERLSHMPGVLDPGSNGY